MTHGALRRALLVQGSCLALVVMALLAVVVNSYVNPPSCYGWCLDLTPVYAGLAAIPFVPPAIVTLIAAWRWRGRSLWPAWVVLVTDAGVLVLTVILLQAYAAQWPSPVPALGLLPLVVVLPALATALLVVARLRPIPWRPALGVSAIGCLVLGGLVFFNVIGPIWQEIPGELSLPFSSAVVYTSHDQGCFDTDQGWTHQHNCYDSALVVYRGSGDPGADQLTIDKAVEDRTRLSPTEGKVEPLPVDRPFAPTVLHTADPRNAGGCLLIIDRYTPPPAKAAYGHCGGPRDYADIRAHWPSNDAYAIGIVYTYTRPG